MRLLSLLLLVSVRSDYSVSVVFFTSNMSEFREFALPISTVSIVMATRKTVAMMIAMMKMSESFFSGDRFGALSPCHASFGCSNFKLTPV